MKNWLLAVLFVAGALGAIVGLTYIVVSWPMYAFLTLCGLGFASMVREVKKDLDG